MAPPLVIAASRAPRRARAIVHAVPVEQRRAPPAARGHAVGEHVEDRLECRAVEVAIRIARRASARTPRRPSRPPRSTPRTAAPGWRAPGGRERVELARTDRADGRRALHEVVAREREEDALRQRPAGVSGPADPLDRGRERARRADVAHEVDRADVDAELERRGRDHDRDLAGLELLLGLEPDAARHAAVVCRDAAQTQALLQRVRDALDEPACSRTRSSCDASAVSATMRSYTAAQSSWFVIGPSEVGNLDARSSFAPVARVDDGRCGARRAHEQPPDLVDRPLRRRQADPLQAAAGERVEPFERERQVRAALVLRDRVDLVDDDRLGVGEELPALLRREQDVERLRVVMRMCGAGGSSPPARSRACRPSGR
jgi:hypothetical protein